jgi:hypothetical protein
MIRKRADGVWLVNLIDEKKSISETFSRSRDRLATVHDVHQSGQPHPSQVANCFKRL